MRLFFGVCKYLFRCWQRGLSTMRAIKVVAILVAGVAVTGPATAQDSHCYSIRDNDEKNYCLALAKRQDSYCYSIRSQDDKNIPDSVPV